MKRLVLLAALPLLAACATAQGGVDPSPQALPDRPLTSWTFVSIDGLPPRSAKAELHIYEGRIAANIGCNSLGGDLEVTPGRLSTPG